ncbi:hypothetical protein Tco_1060271 [Tanacetum coccineum]
MGYENPIRTLEDYSRPSHEGYRNTIELPDGNNVVPLRSNTIRLVQNGCSFHGLRSEDPNQHLMDFLKLVGSLDLDVANRESTRLRLFQFYLRDQASNWLEHLPTRSISTWEDLIPVNLFLKHGLVSRTYSKKSLIMASIFGFESKSVMTMSIPPQGEPSISRPVAISLPQEVPSTSNRRLIELENQVQRLMEADLAPKSSVQVNKIISLCKICSGPHDTQYCMENPKQAFVDYVSSCIDEAGGKWYTFKPEQNNLGDTYNPSWKSHPNLRNSSSPKRVYFINSIPILNKEDEPRDAGIVKPDTKNDDHDIIVKVENESEEEKEGKK